MIRLTPAEPMSRRRLLLSSDVIASLVRMEARRPGMLGRLVMSFRESARDCIDGLWEALACGQPERVRDLTHRLAGTSSQMGAAALAEACKAVSRASAGGEAAQRLCELESVAERSLAELEGIVERSAVF